MNSKMSIERTPVFRYWTPERNELDRLLSETKDRPDRSVLAKLRVWSAEWAAAVKTLTYAHWHQELQDVREASSLMDQTVGNARSETSAASGQFAGLKPPEKLRLLLYSLCAIVAAAAEFSFTWAVLPAVLQIPRFSFLGIVLGLSPVVGGVVLEYLFEMIRNGLGTDNAYISPRMRFCITLFIVLCSIGLIFSMNYYLAESRAIAEKLLASIGLADSPGADLSQLALTPLEQTFLDRAVVVMSMVVVFATALLFMVVLDDHRKWRFFRSSARRLRLAETAASEIEQSAARMKAELEHRTHLWDQREAHMQPLVDMLLAADELRIARLEAIPLPNSPEPPKSPASAKRKRSQINRDVILQFANGQGRSGPAYEASLVN